MHKLIFLKNGNQLFFSLLVSIRILLPFCILLALMVYIVRILRNPLPLTSYRGRTKRKNSTQHSGTAMFVCLAVKFFISRILPVTLNLLQVVKSDIFSSNRFALEISVLITVSNYLVVFNSATNFFVYLYFGREFRRDLFCRSVKSEEGLAYSRARRNALEISGEEPDADVLEFEDGNNEIYH